MTRSHESAELNYSILFRLSNSTFHSITFSNNSCLIVLYLTNPSPIWTAAQLVAEKYFLASSNHGPVYIAFRSSWSVSFSQKPTPGSHHVS